MNLGLTALCHRPHLRGHTSMSLVRGRGTTVAGNIIEHEIRAELSRILQSETFKNSERLQHFLKFAVESALDGTTDRLKESVLGRAVLDRGREFDPRTDSIVRMQAQRLRRRLREYYETEGRDDPVAIKFQPGSYAPTFAHTVEQQAPGGKPETRPLNPQTVAASAPKSKRRSGTGVFLRRDHGRHHLRP